MLAQGHTHCLYVVVQILSIIRTESKVALYKGIGPAVGRAATVCSLIIKSIFM